MRDPSKLRPPGFEIPDLELPPPRPSQSGMRSVRIEEASRDAAAEQAPRSGSFEFEVSFSEVAGPSLEVDHDAPIASVPPQDYRRGAGLLAEDFSSGPDPVLDRAAGGLELDLTWPTGSTPSRARLLLDTVEVKKLAGFGEPPDFWLTPWYAVRVARRRRLLLAQLNQIDPALTRAEAERDRLVQGLAERVRPELERNRDFQSLLAPLRQLERQSPKPEASGAWEAISKPPPAASSSEKEQQPSAALLDLGRAVLRLRGEIPIDSKALEPILRADAEVTKLLVGSELHLRALDACDPEKLRQGQIGWVVVGLGVLTFTLWLLNAT